MQKTHDLKVANFRFLCSYCTQKISGPIWTLDIYQEIVDIDGYSEAVWLLNKLGQVNVKWQ